MARRNGAHPHSGAPVANVDGAGNGVRTRDLKLGKLALYQLSYARTRESDLGHGERYGLTRTVSTHRPRALRRRPRRRRLECRACALDQLLHVEGISVEAHGLDLMPEPGALALRELSGAERGARLGRRAITPALDERDGLVVAHGLERTQRLGLRRVEQRSRLIDEAVIEHPARAPRDALAQRSRRHHDLEVEPARRGRFGAVALPPPGERTAALRHLERAGDALAIARRHAR